MKGYYGKENLCEFSFMELGDCYHIWTPENFHIIFASDEEFKIGMDIIGLCSKMFPDVRIFTFELMTNHLHITAAGAEGRIKAMFERIKLMLKHLVNSMGRSFDFEGFRFGIRKIEELKDMRNVIVYDNKNGFVVSPEHTPFSYPWGANRYYFNQDAVRLAHQNAKSITIRERRIMSHSRDWDKVGLDLFCFDGYVSPVSFCDIAAGERLFRDASHYFFLLSRSVEANRKIAKEIGENVYYNDDELYAAISQVAQDNYQFRNLSTIDVQTKLELAKSMFFEYNASPKQIVRILKLSPEVLASMGITNK